MKVFVQKVLAGSWFLCPRHKARGGREDVAVQKALGRTEGGRCDRWKRMLDGSGVPGKIWENGIACPKQMFGRYLMLRKKITSKNPTLYSK